MVISLSLWSIRRQPLRIVVLSVAVFSVPGMRRKEERKHFCAFFHVLNYGAV